MRHVNDYKNRKTVIRIIIALILSIALLIACSENNIGPIDEEPIDFPCKGNRQPIIESIPDTFVSIGDTVWLQTVAYDPDGDELTYSAYCSNLTWGEIKEGRYPHSECNPITGLFWFFAQENDLPYRTFEISAMDTCRFSVSAGVKIIVFE
jgi:hypothetical protein